MIQWYEHTNGIYHQWWSTIEKYLLLDLIGAFNDKSGMIINDDLVSTMEMWWSSQLVGDTFSCTLWYSNVATENTPLRGRFQCEDHYCMVDFPANEFPHCDCSLTYGHNTVGLKVWLQPWLSSRGSWEGQSRLPRCSVVLIARQMPLKGPVQQLGMPVSISMYSSVRIE